MHAQGTTFDVKEPSGHVHTEPNSVINLVSGESEKERQPVIGWNYGENWVDVNEPNPLVMTLSQMAEQSGENAAPTLFGIPGKVIPPCHQRTAMDDDVNRPSPI